MHIRAGSDANSSNGLAGSWSGSETLCGSMPVNSLWTILSDDFDVVNCLM